VSQDRDQALNLRMP